MPDFAKLRALNSMTYKERDELLTKSHDEAVLKNQNALNARASTGPRTEAGKIRSSQNSLKHGIYAKALVLPGEDREEYLTFSTERIAALKPQDAIQSDLAQAVADSLWRLRRIRSAETSQFTRV